MQSQNTPPRDRWNRDRKQRGIYYRVKADGTKTWARFDSSAGRIVKAQGDRQSAIDAQAQDRLRKSAGLPAPDRKVLVRDLAEEVRTSKRGRLKASSFREWERQLDTVILPAFGHLRPAHVTPERVAKLIRELERRGLSPATIRSYLRSLRSISRLAIRRGAIAVDPLELLTEEERPREAERRARLQWDPDIMSRLLDAARELDARPEARATYYPLILTLALTGCRVGEALALTWADVDLLEAVVHVRGSWSRSRQVTTPKTRASTRTVPVPAQLVDVLVQHKPENANENDFVFAARHGRGPISYWNFRSRGFAEAAERAGLAGQVTIHDLRHAAASLLIWAGLTPVEVAAHLGHRDATTTLAVYSHLFDRSDAHARARAAFAVLNAGR